jgi:hypothetical protein
MWMSAQDFSMVVRCVKLLTKLMLILGLGRCSSCQMKIYIDIHLTRTALIYCSSDIHNRDVTP